MRPTGIEIKEQLKKWANSISNSSEIESLISMEME